MEQLKKPIWLVLSFILPMILLIFLFNETFQIIESLLTVSQKSLWVKFGYYFIILIFVSVIYSGYMIVKKKNVDSVTSWVVLLINIFNITLYFFFIDEVLPRNIPDWMFTSSDLTIYPYSFLIPGALYSMIILVMKYTPSPTTKNPYINLLALIGVPVTVFASFSLMGIFSYYNSSNLFLFKYLPIFILVFLTCLFLFYLIRFVYILSSKSKKRDTLELILKILFTCVFPVAGLFFNNVFESSRGGIFGNFQNPIFYILSIVNGIVICFPYSKNLLLRWSLFITKSILLMFILYFFTIFLPFLPLSILAILAVGFGFLMLAPIIVFVYQLASIRNDIIFLKSVSKKSVVYGVFVISMLVLPTIITLKYKADRYELNKILTFIYNRNYDDNEEYSFNNERIDRLLNHIHDVKSTFINHTPFLDSYYNWIVLDNLMLSDKKIDEISSIFKGDVLKSKHTLFSWFTFPERNAHLENYQVETKYNGSHWTSFVHLNIANSQSQDSEFRMYLTTPPDCFISNYYLEIEGKREYGIIAEKKSANWVYNNIVNTRMDPGILNTIGYNKYMLKIFPVQQFKNRISGIEFTHKEPIEISINNTKISLGDSLQNKDAYEICDGQGIFIPNTVKQSLKKTIRTPEYHIIIDKSINNKMSNDKISDIIDNIKSKLILSNKFKLWTANYDIKSLSNDLWKNEIKNFDSKGGFYPEYLMKKIIIESLNKDKKNCPIFILVTPNSSSVTFVNGFSNLMFALPDIKYFYTYNQNNVVSKFDLESNKMIGIENLSSIRPDSSFIFNWNNFEYFLPFNNNSEYLFDSITIKPQTKWEKGVLLEQSLRKYSLNPNLDEAWYDIIKSSMKYGIVSPFTSYISLENEAQKKALLNKQKNVLESNENFDLEEAEPMSEPSVIWYLLIVILVFITFKKFRL